MRICILDDVYDCPAWEAVPDDWRVDPTPFMKAHDFTVVGLTKETAVSTLTKSSRVETVFSLRFQARRMMAKYGSALIEEFIEGREFTVLVAENPELGERLRKSASDFFLGMRSASFGQP